MKKEWNDICLIEPITKFRFVNQKTYWKNVWLPMKEGLLAYLLFNDQLSLISWLIGRFVGWKNRKQTPVWKFVQRIIQNRQITVGEFHLDKREGWLTSIKVKLLMKAHQACKQLQTISVASQDRLESKDHRSTWGCVLMRRTRKYWDRTDLQPPFYARISTAMVE